MKRAVLAMVVLLVAACSDAGDQQQPTNVPAVDAECDAADHRFVSSVSADGRYFEDQYGDPVLVRGDSPWSGMADWSPEQAELYFTDRESNGFNASIMSAIVVPVNGGPSYEGATFDGIEPFVDGDITQWNEAYWSRVDDYLRIACRHGNTVFLYPMDGWNLTTCSPRPHPRKPSNTGGDSRSGTRSSRTSSG